MRPRAVAVVSLLCTMFVGLPVSAHDGHDNKVDAKLYEVTENMSLDNLSMPMLRTSTAALQGTATLGSPSCPVDLVQLLAGLGLLTRMDKPCTVTVIATDRIETHTGSGELIGTFAVVINLDNPTDPPEFVVMTGEFAGKLQVAVDTSVNPPRQLPLINLTDGKFTPMTVFGVPIDHVGMVCVDPNKPETCLDPEKFAPAPFTGVFRLPFTVDKRGWRHRAVSNREAFYLGDHGQLIKVQPDERSLGFPTLRVEINF